MVLGLTSAQLTELGLAANSFGHLIELRFSGGTLYYTDRPHNVVYGGNTYTATGNVLGIDEIEESLDMRVQEYEIVLSGVNTANAAAALTGFSLGRVGLIRRALFDANNQAIDAPFIIAQGYIDSYSLDEDADAGDSALAVTVANHWSDFERTAGRITNNRYQQMFFPGDLGFEFTGDLDPAGRLVL